VLIGTLVRDKLDEAYHGIWPRKSMLLIERPNNLFSVKLGINEDQ
jgi:hypothetical protein